MSLETQPLLRLLLEQQAGMTPELRALMGCEGAVIDGTAKEVMPDRPDAPDTNPAQEISAQLEALRQLTGKDRIDLDAWRDEAERAERIIDALTAKLDMLACALGACPGCWGSADPCEACGGRGRGAPGAFLPDPECFDTYVTPVLHLMAGQAPRRRSRPKAETQNHPQDPTNHGDLT